MMNRYLKQWWSNTLDNDKPIFSPMLVQYSSHTWTQTLANDVPSPLDLITITYYFRRLSPKMCQDSRHHLLNLARSTASRDDHCSGGWARPAAPCRWAGLCGLCGGQAEDVSTSATRVDDLDSTIGYRVMTCAVSQLAEFDFIIG